MSEQTKKWTVVGLWCVALAGAFLLPGESLTRLGLVLLAFGVQMAYVVSDALKSRDYVSLKFSAVMLACLLLATGVIMWALG